MWTQVIGKGSLATSDIDDPIRFKQYFAQRPNQIIRRVCTSCFPSSHQDIYYKRKTPVPAALDLLDLMKNNWFSTNNQFHVDFDLYSSYGDALTDTNPWQFCNFDDPRVGFPRDCGPTVRVNSNWNSFIVTPPRAKDFAFYIETDTSGSGGGASGDPIELPENLVSSNSTCYQVSTYAGASCERAIDGNWNGQFQVGSTTHTHSTMNPWWLVDLGKFASIKQVVFANREDCCWNRLKNIKVEIMKSVAGPVIAEKFVEGQLGRLTTVDFAEPVVGRVVRLTSINADRNVLSLAEVAVYGDDLESQVEELPNVAQGKECTQISDWGGGVCGRALDGNTNGLWNQSSVTHTRSHMKPWWMVDLGKFYDVSEIIIFNREDCCGNRLANVDIEVLTSLAGTQAGMKQLSGAQGRFAGAFFDEPVTGRYVKITANHSSNIPLSLAEVMVHAKESEQQPEPLSDVALDAIVVRQSSTAYGGVATRANDGNNDGSFNNLSVTHTYWERAPFWISSFTPTKVNEVLLWNRLDCCTNRLANVKVGLYSDIDATTLIAEKEILGQVGPFGGVAFDGVEAVAVKVSMDGTATNTNHVLSLAEVEVMGVPVEGAVELKNVALNKPATQSSTAYGGEASRAVDGNTSTPWNSQTLTHTSTQSNPWWSVNLEETYSITEVLFVNRWDCCWNRLTNPVIDILDNSDNVVATKTFDGMVPRGGMGRITFPSVGGSKVKISLLGSSKVLTLSEVMVLADTGVKVTGSPTKSPIAAASAAPSKITATPSLSSKPSISTAPSAAKSQSPSTSNKPSRSPAPSKGSTSAPSTSKKPSRSPAPSKGGTSAPSTSNKPSLSSAPSGAKSQSPSISNKPTTGGETLPEPSPVAAASANPSAVPSSSPIAAASSNPSPVPSSSPSATASDKPSDIPSYIPTVSTSPTTAPSKSFSPTEFPTISQKPSGAPYAFQNVETLQESIIKDMLPKSSSKCMGTGETFSSDSVFASSQATSKWSEDFAGYEQDLFLKKMVHNDADSDRSWTIRIGKGGNIYSFVGPMGETVPPQEHAEAPWIDEVWQTVSVDQNKNTSANPYFIHQAGVYQKDTDFTETATSLVDKPFYSPSMGDYCRDSIGECAFVSWGQQAHVPTTHESGMLYLDRYKDCGEGVVEHTRLLHANVGNTDKLDYLNVPWGGVRTSSLRDLVIARKSGEYDIIEPMHTWGDTTNPDALIDLDETLGYTMFVEDLVSSIPIDDWTAPCTEESPSTCLQLVLKGACSESPNHTKNHGSYTLYCPIEPTALIKTGESRPVMLQNSRNGESAKFTNGVLHWSWNTNSFYGFSDVTAEEFNNLFAVGDDIEVTYFDTGKPEEENRALAHVHGNKSKWLSPPEGEVPNRLRIGKGGSIKRDYTVYTVNARPSALTNGGTYFFRQYFIMDKYSQIKGPKGALWADETYQAEYQAGAVQGRSIELYASAGDGEITKFGAVVNGKQCNANNSLPLPTVKCTGSTTPKPDSKALYQIKCADQYYVGSDPYFFEPDGESKRPYICKNDETARAEWTLLGFFVAGSCDALMNAQYDSTFCI
jgi:hypothetical protein